MSNTLKVLTIYILDDENGISETAWASMNALMEQQEPEFWSKVVEQVRCQDSRYFLPEDHTCIELL